SIHDGRKEILPDLGTTAYGVPDCYAWYQKTISHNTVTVDKKNQKTTAGEITLFEPTSDGGSIKAVSDSAYAGVRMCRSLSLDGLVLTDRFTCESEDDHVYDYTLILRDSIALPAARRDTLPEYERISSVSKSRGKGSCSFELRDGTELILNVQVPYELYTGVAPGIPPKGLKPGEDVYPLIIRIKGKKMDIETIWKLVD
ncbi:heparinase II/III domain-containing protein, partial [Alistipes putredinis]|uniref:heparinase II/III domain-containing protein n=1 Tax=Alistipes putredinis TaxID=28117 RepID=UPI003AB851DD